VQNKIKMNKLFEVLPPMMPNFVRFKKEAGFPIKNFTREEAEEYAELMRKTFIEHWERGQNER
jgi:hypothetical protein